MSYENIGTPTGNNLYITIPLRGTQNWDQKLKDGFFIKVSEHDHTPGKGAAIVEAALDAALQAKVAAIATNTSEIAQNATNIQQNAAEILTNAQNIATNTSNILSSNQVQNLIDASLYPYVLQSGLDAEVDSLDLDIAGLDTRLTTAESSISSLQTGQAQESIEIVTQSDANALANTTIEAASIIIKSNNITVSNVTFKGCDVLLDQTSTFTSCSFSGCDIKGISLALNTINFNEPSMKWTNIQGFDSINFNNSSTSDITLSQVTIPTSFTKVYINATNTNAINITDSNIEGYDIDIYGRSIITFSKIDVVSKIKFYPIADNSIRISSKSLLRADTSEHVGTEFVRVSDSASIFVRGNGGAKFKTFSGGTIIDNAATSLPPYKVINEVYSAFDAGLVPSGTPSNGDTLVYNSTSGEWEPQAASSGNTVAVTAKLSSNFTINSSPVLLGLDATDIDNGNNFNTTNHYLVAPSSGVYAVSFQIEFIGTSFYDGWVFIKKTDSSGNNPTTISPEFPAMLPENQNRTYSSGEVFVELLQNERIEVYVRTTTTNGTASIGATDSRVNIKKIV